MLEQFLHEQFEIAFEWGVPKPEMPGSITQNLNPAFELRRYQEDAFASFIHYFNTDLSGKEKPVHLLFNMATGSGKTLIMAGLILYLKLLTFENTKYRLIGLPFYNEENENPFWDALNVALTTMPPVQDDL